MKKYKTFLYSCIVYCQLSYTLRDSAKRENNMEEQSRLFQCIFLHGWLLPMGQRLLLVNTLGKICQNFGYQLYIEPILDIIKTYSNFLVRLFWTR